MTSLDAALHGKNATTQGDLHASVELGGRSWKLKILVIYRSGRRAYSATRILLQEGFKATNLAGGMLSRAHAETFWES